MMHPYLQKAAVGGPAAKDRAIRLAVFCTHPIQYQVPLWRALAASPLLHVEVFYATDMSIRGYRDTGFGTTVKWDVPLTDGYAHTFLSRDPQIQRVTPWHPGAGWLGSLLDRFQPDVALITAYGGRFWLEVILQLRLRGVPVVLRHEASDTAAGRGAVRHLLRDLCLRVLYSQISGFGAIGTAAKRHLNRLGVSAARVVDTPYCVDSDLLEAQARRWLPQRPFLRAALGVAAEDCIFLFSGKLVPKKAPLLLLRALGNLRPESLRRVHLLVLGDGEQRGMVEAEGRRLLGERCHVLGFINQSELGRYYASADCLVLPSEAAAGETWGLVVNEALHFGLPVIASDGVGCHPDLIPDRRTGQVFPSGDASALARHLDELAGELPGRRGDYAAQAAARIENFTSGKVVQGLVKLVQSAAHLSGIQVA